MRSICFDLAARSIGRRGVLGGVIALGAVRFSLPVQDARAVGEPCPERGAGGHCRNGGQCCSNRCKKKRGRRKGKCRCSALRAPCAEDRDCCGYDPLESGHPVCDTPVPGTGGKRCCMLNQAPCQTSFDCCVPFAYDAGGFCRPE